MSDLVQIDVDQIEALSKRLSRIDSETLGRVSLRAVNAVAHRGYDQSLRLMLSGVNLTESYVKERTDVEEATDPRKPVAKIIAFRPGGQRKPNTKPVNLRQYQPRLTLTNNNWSNSGVAADSGRLVFKTGAKTTFYENPRKPGALLPFKKRKGNAALNIPVGQKAVSISVEVIAGQRKTLKAVNGFDAFIQRMRNGELLVMRRIDKNGGSKKKGRIESLHSLSVAQLFNFAKAKVIPLIAADLEASVTAALAEELEKAVNQ